MSKIIQSVVASGIAAVGLAGISQTGFADDVTTANVSITSHYIFRGQDLSNNGPAVQGGFDYAHESGAYAGIWGSSSSLGADAHGNGVNSAEIDFYVGYATEIKEYGIGIDLGYLHYDYPHTDNEDDELYFIASYNDLSVGIWLELDSDTDKASNEGGTEEADAPADSNSSNTRAYFNIGYDYSLPADFILSLAVGYQTFDTDSELNEDTDSFEEFDEVVDWLIGISKDVGGVELGLAYTDTDDDRIGFEDGDNITVSISKSF